MNDFLENNWGAFDFSVAEGRRRGELSQEEKKKKILQQQLRSDRLCTD